MSDESTDEPLYSTSSSTVGKHIYFHEAHDDDHDDEDPSTPKIIERPVSSTIRVDSSDLISRCKDFIPLLSDTATSVTDKERSNAMNDNEEFNLPELEEEDSKSEKSAKESGEASSSADEEIVKKKRKKKKKKKKKKPKPDDTERHDDLAVHNPDVVSAQ